MKPCFAFWLAVILTAASAGAETYRFDQDHGVLEFTVRHFAGRVSGRFHRFHGTLELDPDQLEKSQVSAAVDVASIDTANSDRDAHLRSAEFFDVAKYPTAVFQSTAVRRVGNAEAQVTGNLTLHGVTRPLVLTVRAANAAGKINPPRVTRWQATADLKRSDFGLVWNPLIEASQAVGGVTSLQISLDALRP